MTQQNTSINVDDIIADMRSSMGISSETNQEENNSSETSEITNTESEISIDSQFPDRTNLIQTEENTLRFRGASWFEEMKKQDFTIIGAGGISSWAALFISRLHPSFLSIVDLDTVNTVNLAGQFYKYNDIGKYKVSAVKDNIKMFSDFSSISACVGNIQSRSYLLTKKICICGVDNMDARKYSFNHWKENLRNIENKAEYVFIDGRLSADTLQVFCIKGDDEYHIKKYSDEWLFDQEEAEETVCSFKQTSYMAGMIGSIITNLCINFVYNKIYPDLEKPLPFMTEYNGDLMFFKTED